MSLRNSCTLIAASAAALAMRRRRYGQSEQNESLRRLRARLKEARTTHIFDVAGWGFMNTELSRLGKYLRIQINAPIPLGFTSSIFFSGSGYVSPLYTSFKISAAVGCSLQYWNRIATSKTVISPICS